MQKRNDKADKCTSCYWVIGCMLTPATAKDCGGPFKDEQARLKFIEEYFKKR